MEIFVGPYPILPFRVILCDKGDDYHMLEEELFRPVSYHGKLPHT